MNKEYPIILSIAGSDPSGGAGIQADIKTISALGGYAAAAITAVTSQNTTGVFGVKYMPAKLIASQIEAVINDLNPSAIKIGMTGSISVIKAIGRVLRRLRPENIVLDPVMVSTSRHSLTREEAIDVLCKELFNLSRLITPNLNEATRLVGRKISNVNDMESAAIELHQRYGCAVLVKGGDMCNTSNAVDVLCDEFGIRTFSAPVIRTKNLHGTGCTLSSAIATLLGSGHSLHDAIRMGKEYVTGAIIAASGHNIGHGNGPLHHFYHSK